MKKKKVKHVIGTAMLIGCIMSPIALSFTVANKTLYVDIKSISLTLIISSFFFFPIVIGSLFRKGISETNVYTFMWAVIAICVGLISTLASPWYIFISLFGVVFMFLFEQ